MKINLGLSKQDASKNSDSFSEADFEEFGLGMCLILHGSSFPSSCGCNTFIAGRKGKSYILALIRMHRLAVNTMDGSVIYRIIMNEID